MMRGIVLSLGFLVCAHGFAAVADMPLGRGALLYDAISNTGPSGKKTRDPGHWVSDIQAFNAGANTAKQITALYPYTGDVETNCTSPSDCVYSGAKKNVFVYYDVGLTSVKAYHDAFSSAKILPIIDGKTNGAYLKAFTYAAVGTATAGLVTAQVCQDENADGIFFDLEPFDISVPGQFSFYSALSKQFVSSACIDASHPNGRIFGVFLSPNKVHDWGKVKAAFGHVGYAAVSAYDIQDTDPPKPTSMKLYHSSVTGMLGTMDNASRTYKIPYRVVVPWAASFGEFNQYGLYDTSAPNDFKLIKNYTPEGLTQLAYVQAARAIITATCKSPYYLGMDGWSWSQYKAPNKPVEEQLVLPTLPSGDVVSYLQKN
jgi:hypothetical protein